MVTLWGEGNKAAQRVRQAGKEWESGIEDRGNVSQGCVVTNACIRGSETTPRLAGFTHAHHFGYAGMFTRHLRSLHIPHPSGNFTASTSLSTPPLLVPFHTHPAPPPQKTHLLQKLLSSRVSSPSRTFLGGAWSLSCNTQQRKRAGDTEAGSADVQGLPCHHDECTHTV
jgi:hypothetical protein